MRNITLTIFAIILFYAATLRAEPSDSWLEGSIQGALWQSSILSSSDIKVEIKDGVVTLNGKTDSDLSKNTAEEIVNSFEGVREVNNKLTVEPGTKPQQAQNQPQRIRDATTNAAVRSRISSNRDLHDNQINVTTIDGITELNGNVDTYGEHEEAERIALNTTGVRDVKNRLSVSEEPLAIKKLKANAEIAGQTVTEGVSDAWITAKVRANILLSGNASGSSIDIETANSIVTLSGIARDAEQRDEIAEIARQVVGVKQVRNKIAVRE